MRTIVTHMPSAEHSPAGRVVGNGKNPVLYLDKVYGHNVIQFNPDTPDATIAYLTTLVAEASQLLEAVKAAQS